MAEGVKESEIAFIHDYESQDDKDRLFDAVNAGEIRILIGSTAKMGIGMNVQKRVTALHELNPPPDRATFCKMKDGPCGRGTSTMKLPSTPTSPRASLTV